MNSFAKRLGSALIVVWLTVSLAFAAQALLPTDPARAIAGPQARPADVALIRHQLRLDRPFLAQYSSYLLQLAKGDLGTSYQRRRPVVAIIRRRAPATLMLGLAALVIEILFGTIAGTVAAVWRKTTIDRATIAVTLLGVSSPTFVTGLLLQYWVGFRLRWLPLDSMGESSWELVKSLLLPATTLGVFGAAFYARIVRDEMVKILQQPYMRTARAKGLSPARRVVIHGLRNAAMPLITMFGMDLGTIIGGAVVTEQVFRWPGLGALAVEAVLARDTPIIMGLVVVSTLSVVTATIVVDLLYVLLDPTIRRARVTQ